MSSLWGSLEHFPAEARDHQLGEEGHQEGKGWEMASRSVFLFYKNGSQSWLHIRITGSAYNKNQSSNPSLRPTNQILWVKPRYQVSSDMFNVHLELMATLL